MSGIRAPKWRDESGMTLIEIVIASAILFVILTGILGLVAQTTRMTALAKQQNAQTNAISAYSEWLHTLPFEKLALVGDGEGILEPEHVISMDGFTVTFRSVVTPGANDMLKNVRIDGQIVRADGWTHEISTSIIVRDRSQFLTQAAHNPDTDPFVYFQSSTPPVDAIVWDDDWSGGPLYLATYAEASEGRNLTSLTYLINDMWTCIPTIGDPANWTPDQQWYQVTDFVWNTRQDTDGTPLKDGRHLIKVSVVDDSGVSKAITRYFRVNNFPPKAPGAPAALMLPSGRVKVGWIAAPQPPTADPVVGMVSGYELNVYRLGATTADRVLVGAYVGTGTSYEFNIDVSHWMSRYMAEVRTTGPRHTELNHTGFTSPWVRTEFESRPRITGTYTITKQTTNNPKFWRTDAQMTVSPPAFATAVPPTYTFHRVVNGVLQTPPLYSGPLNTCTHAVQVNSNNMNKADYPETSYVCVVTYTPEGETVARTLRSNTVTTTYKDSESGTHPFTEGTW